MCRRIIVMIEWRYIIGIARYLFERNKLFVRSSEWSKNKSQERTVRMLSGNYYFAFLINRVNCICMTVEYFMQVFLWRYSNKEYRKHDPAYYFYYLFFQKISITISNHFTNIVPKNCYSNGATAIT
jgi:hypothetical protein